MKRIFFFIAATLSLTSIIAQNAIKKVIVETYYISDANDATDTTGGFLEIGSKTYRIYIQMQPGCKLTKVYGDSKHALKIGSTENFFNNIDRGKSFARDIGKNKYKYGTLALDTWLTLGHTATNLDSTHGYFGVLKTYDDDGSFVGGAHNDGGSAGILGGLLNNNDVLAGIPLTTSDGMRFSYSKDTSWSSYGIVDISGVDSTIFGSAKVGKQFISNIAYIQNSGVMGVNPDSNQVLVAQLTTKGDIFFELNVVIKDTLNGTEIKYVAANDTLDEIISGYLKYPPTCGCMDPNFFEYSKNYICSAPDSCKNRIVLGCMDPNACNYDPNANYNVQDLCCYPGLCADRDISLVCPDLGNSNKSMIKLYPNPANEQVVVEAELADNSEAKYIVYNSFGNVEFENDLGRVSGLIKQSINISGLAPGIYLVRVYTSNSVVSNTFIKN